MSRAWPETLKGCQMDRLSSEIYNELLDTLEELIDSLDDCWQSENEGKWRSTTRIREGRVQPAKLKFKRQLDDYIDRRLETYFKKYGIPETGDDK
jgi:hypothetical protein